MEQAAEKLLKDTKAFTDAVNSAYFPPYYQLLVLTSSIRPDLFTAGAGYATHFSTILSPISGEYDLIGNHPNASQTINSVNKYESHLEELRGSVGPELELIESRVAGPTKELQTILKTIRKTITKREHKVRMNVK